MRDFFRVRPTAGTRGGADGFLALFRRRSLAAGALRLCFAAALAGEVLRWATVAINLRFGLRLPLLVLGPFVLAGLLLGLFRRWSPRVTARRADRTFALRDRLSSYVDFSSRRDIPAAFREAQARETESALAGRLPLRLPRLPGYLVLGPVLLVAGALYPFVISGLTRNRAVVTRHYPETPVAGEPGSGPESPPPAAEKPRAGSEERDPEPPAVPPPPPDPKLPALPEGSAKYPKEGDPPRQPVTELPPRSGSPLESFQVGERLTRVVDPRSVGTRTAGGRETGLGGGTIFRFFPAPAGEGPGIGSAATGGRGSEVVVDIAGVPLRYRALVERYFALLGASDGASDGASPP